MSLGKYRGIHNGGWKRGYLSYDYKCNEYLIVNSQGTWPVIPETVGQYIGKKDKTGVEICDGDIDKSGGVVIWNQDDASFYMDHPSEMHALVDTEEWFEIIGDRHQNPELLENK